MDREIFKTLAAGKYAMSNLEGTIDKSQMLSFVDGATYAYDLLKKQATKGGKNETNEESTRSTDSDNESKPEQQT